MLLVWTVSSYARCHLLPRIIASFERQTYENRRMVILEDGGQLYTQPEGEKWKVVSIDKRFPSLGKKRNACIELARHLWPEADAAMPVDDDDLPMIWHTEATAEALKESEWSRPSVILSTQVVGGRWFFQPTETGDRRDPTKSRLYHPSWGFRISAWERAGGYPEHLSGPEDQGLMRKMEANGTVEADPIALGYAPSYCYIWERGQSISSMLHSQLDPNGEKAWAKCEKKLEPATLEKWEFPFDPHHLPNCSPIVRPRPF